MKTEDKKYCCFCFSCSSEGAAIDSDILELLKFITVDVNISALENSKACDDCLSKLLAASNYKTRNSSKMLRDANNREMNSEKFKMCQMCDKTFEQEQTIPLVECITCIDWLDFVNYLFVDQDIKSLESSQLCDTCRVSVSDIQDFLKLLFVYDQSKIKRDNDNIEAKDEHKVEVKREFENLIEGHKIEIRGNRNENDDDIGYEDFKCKTEEVDLKMEYDDGNQSAYSCYRINVKEIISNDNSLMNDYNEEEEGGVNCLETHCDKDTNEIRKSKLHNTRGNMSSNNSVHNQGCKCTDCLKGSCSDNNLLKNSHNRYNVKNKLYECQKCSYTTTVKKEMSQHYRKHGKDNYIRDFKCTLCSKEFTCKTNLDHHLLTTHYSRDNVTSKIYECEKCSYATTKKRGMLQHNIKHGIKDNSRIFKCQQCTYETYNKSHFSVHMKSHNNVGSFKCTLCSKEFTVKMNLDHHLLTVHSCRDNVTSKIYECNKCSYATTRKGFILQHNIKHGIKDNSHIFKCQHCTYKTYKKSHLSTHMKIHNTIRDFKCTLCSKGFIEKINLDNHLLKIHNCRDNITSKVYDCANCNYTTTKKVLLLQHNIKHGIKDNLQVFKCHLCTYETYNKTNFSIHAKRHSNIRDFKCTLCSQEFTLKINLDHHLLTMHNCRDVTSKIYDCEKCSYATTRKAFILQHNIKHGIKDNSCILKCPHCTYETYKKSHLNIHIKRHKFITVERS